MVFASFHMVGGAPCVCHKVRANGNSQQKDSVPSPQLLSVNYACLIIPSLIIGCKGSPVWTMEVFQWQQSQTGTALVKQAARFPGWCQTAGESYRLWQKTSVPKQHFPHPLIGRHNPPNV